MIAAVLLRLFYLIWHVLGPVLLMGRTTSSVQHVGRGRAPIPIVRRVSRRQTLTAIRHQIARASNTLTSAAVGVSPMSS